MRYIRSLTLQDLCLESIIKHLDFFINHKDDIPQRHISFLLHLYSKEIFTQYTSSHSKTEECLLWFLSAPKNVILPCITQRIVERLQTVGSVITSLTLQETMASESVLNSVICCVPHLSYLDLRNTSCSDNTLLCIQKMCPGLVTLNIQDCYCVTNSGMLNLCGNNLSLKNLNISKTSVELIGLYDILVGMPSLQCLTFDNMAESFYDIFKSDGFYVSRKDVKFNLTELIYEKSFENPEEVLYTWSVFCPNVEKISISVPVSQQVLHLCSRFIHLKEFIFLSRMQTVNGYILDPLTPLLLRAQNITTLKLSCVEQLPSVTLIECFKNVKHLHLNSVTFTDFTDEDIISQNTNLDSLTLRNLPLYLTDYKFLKKLISLSKNVTQLAIRRMARVPSNLVDVILNSMKNLIFIEFSFIRTELPSSIFKFFDIPTVQQVYIDGCLSGPVQFSTDSCTLAWRIMNDIDAEDEYFDYEIGCGKVFKDGCIYF